MRNVLTVLATFFVLGFLCGCLTTLLQALGM